MKSVADGMKSLREGAGRLAAGRLTSGRLASGRGWLALELALVAVLAVQGARLVMIFVADSPAATPLSITAAPADPGVFARFDAFFRTGGQGSLAEATGAEASQMRLYGVRAGGADGGSAIIGLSDGKQVSVAVGETVLPGLILKAVADDHVVLARGASLSRLIFTEKPEGAPAPPPPPPGPQVMGPSTTSGTAPAPLASGPWHKAAPPTPAVDPAQLMAQASLRPRLRGARIDGFTVGARGEAPLLRATGLQPGDVVLSVNGTPLNSLERVSDLRQDLANTDTAEIRFERNGQVQTTTIRTGR